MHYVGYEVYSSIDISFLCLFLWATWNRNSDEVYNIDLGKPHCSTLKYLDMQGGYWKVCLFCEFAYLDFLIRHLIN